jgi:hypothetical protein
MITRFHKGFGPIVQHKITKCKDLVLVGDTGSGFTKGAYNSWKTMPDSDMKGSVLVLK